MTIEEAREYWSRRLERASGYSDEHWDADERHAHADYIDALKHAVTALAICREYEETAGGRQAMNVLLTCFLWICDRSACYGCPHPEVYPATWCAKDTGISLYRVRKAFKRLANAGYVEKDYEGGWDDWNERLYCIHGYSLTENGRNTSIWKRFDREEIEYIKRSLRSYDG